MCKKIICFLSLDSNLKKISERIKIEIKEKYDVKNQNEENAFIIFSHGVNFNHSCEFYISTTGSIDTEKFKDTFFIKKDLLFKYLQEYIEIFEKLDKLLTDTIRETLNLIPTDNFDKIIEKIENKKHYELLTKNRLSQSIKDLKTEFDNIGISKKKTTIMREEISTLLHDLPYIISKDSNIEEKKKRVRDTISKIIDEQIYDKNKKKYITNILDKKWLKELKKEFNLLKQKGANKYNYQQLYNILLSVKFLKNRRENNKRLIVIIDDELYKKKKREEFCKKYDLKDVTNLWLSFNHKDDYKKQLEHLKNEKMIKFNMKLEDDKAEKLEEKIFTKKINLNSQIKKILEREKGVQLSKRNERIKEEIDSIIKNYNDYMADKTPVIKVIFLSGQIWTNIEEFDENNKNNVKKVKKVKNREILDIYHEINSLTETLIVDLILVDINFIETESKNKEKAQKFGRELYYHMLLNNLDDYCEIKLFSYATRNANEINKFNLTRFQLEKLLEIYSIDNQFAYGGKMMKKIVAKIDNFALQSSSKDIILLTGDSGSGKGVLAKRIHNKSGRSGNFRSINLSAIQEELFAIELFGYVSGAFTDANKHGKKGIFEIANGGTLFIDEIGEASLEIQVKLLKVIEERVFIPVGGEKEILVDVRIIVATNRDLLELIRDGKFRNDLYQRLNILSLDERLPSLSKRLECKEDYKALVDYYKLKETLEINSDYENLYEKIKEYSWPGNVRELFSVFKKASFEKNNVEKEIIKIINKRLKSKLDILRPKATDLLSRIINQKDNHIYSSKVELEEFLGVKNIKDARKIFNNLLLQIEENKKYKLFYVFLLYIRFDTTILKNNKDAVKKAFELHDRLITKVTPFKKNLIVNLSKTDINKEEMTTIFKIIQEEKKLNKTSNPLNEKYRIAIETLKN